jgi:hypothetical protein
MLFCLPLVGMQVTVTMKEVAAAEMLEAATTENLLYAALLEGLIVNLTEDLCSFYIKDSSP